MERELAQQHVRPAYPQRSSTYLVESTPPHPQPSFPMILIGTLLDAENAHDHDELGS